MTTPKKKPIGKKSVGKKPDTQLAKPPATPLKKGATPTAANPKLCPICGGHFVGSCIHNPPPKQRVSNLLIAPGARVHGVQMLPELRLTYVARRVAQNTGDHRLYAFDLAQEMGVSVGEVYQLIKHLRDHGAGVGSDFPHPLGIENTQQRGYVAAHVANQADDISFLGIVTSKLAAVQRQYRGTLEHIKGRFPNGQVDHILRTLEICLERNPGFTRFFTTLADLHEQQRATPDIVF